MSSYKTQGIVLKGTNFGEADRILTVMTERFGKVKAIAKGIRKIKSHLAGSLEPFMLVDLQLYEGKTFFIVTGAVIGKEFPNVHSNLQKTAQAFFLGELVDKFLQENQKLPEIFELLTLALESLENASRLLLVRAFELKIVEASGFKPELYECVHCKKSITAENNFWDPVEGGVICAKCQDKFHHGRDISDLVIKLFRFIEKNDFGSINRLKLDQKVEDEAERIMTEYVSNILERELKSRRFLKML